MTFSACRSSWICASVLLASVAAHAQESLRVRPGDREQVTSAPRQVVATAFRVQNVSSAAMEIEARVVLPARWQLVTPPLPYTLAPRESTLQLVSFTIPEDERAGDYVVSYEARDRLHPAISDAYALQVHVSAAPGVQVAIVGAPDFAVAGDRLAATAVFRNSGNLAMTVKFTASGRNLGVVPARGELHLEPAQLARVDLELDVDRVRTRAAARLVVSATLSDAVGETQAQAPIQVAPRASALDAMRTLDSRVETRWVARDSPAGRSSGWQAVIAGGGILDEERRDLLRYHFQGPDLRQGGTYGAAEESWVRYDAPNFSAGAGDLVYGLTPLTEPGRMGRGSQVEYRGDRWGATAYGMRDVFGDGGADQWGAGSHLRLGDATTLGLQFLDRTGTNAPGQVWSLGARSEWSPALNFDVEAAQSSAQGVHGGALRFALHDNRRPVQFYALGWGADPEFSGPLRDKLYLSTGFDYPNLPGWGARGYYRLQNWNLLPPELADPDLRARVAQSDLMQAAPAESETSLGTSHALAGGRATLDLVYRERSGSLSATPVNLQSASWRAGFDRAWQRVSLFCTVERGQAQDLVRMQRFNTASEMVSASLRVGRSQAFSAWWLRDENTRLDPRAPSQESMGLSASMDAGAGFQLRVDAQRSESAYGRAAIYDLSLAYQSAGGGRLQFAARRLEGRFARTDLMLNYSLPFALPVIRKPGFSALRGRVYDAETSAGLGNVVLRLDGMTTATRRGGEFLFPAVARGAHRIVIDRTPGVDQVPASPAALKVEVGDVDPPPVLIGVVRAAAIVVRVSMQPDEPGAARGAAGVLVVFRMGDTEFRRLSDAEGKARLGSIPPGSWTITVSRDTLPAGYRLAGDSITIGLTPGATASTELQLVRQHREMRMLAPLAVRRAGSGS